MAELFIPAYNGQSLEELTDYVIRLQRELNHKFMFLSDKNIAKLDADNCVVTNISAASIKTDELIVGTNVQIGTAQDAAGVTSIIGGTVTTSFVNALDITAESVNAGWVYAGNINANQINTGTLSSVTIDVATNAKIGNNLTLGTTGDRTIVMSGTASIDFSQSSGSMTISAAAYVKVGVWYFSSSAVIAGASLDMNSYDITDVGNLYTKSECDSRFVEAGTGGAKTISHINGTVGGIVVWYTDGTNGSIFFD